MNEPPGTHACCLTGLTIAEYFRDAEGQDVFSSLITSFVSPAAPEVSALRSYAVSRWLLTHGNENGANW